MPRRRVSVAVVPKFNSLNIPGQSPTASPIPSMPSLVSKTHNLKTEFFCLKYFWIDQAIAVKNVSFFIG